MQYSLFYNNLFLTPIVLESAGQMAEGGYHVEESDHVRLPVFF